MRGVRVPLFTGSESEIPDLQGVQKFVTKVITPLTLE